MAAKKTANALAPLDALLQDPDISEIMVDRLDRVIVERKGQLEASGVAFDSPEALRAAIDAVLALGGVKFAPGQTVAEARLADDSRVLAVLPPTAVDGPYLVLRKVSRSPMTKDRLMQVGAISPEAYALMQSAIRGRVNLIIAGGTGSGKTTFLNVLTGEIPADERVIVVEEAVELQPHHPLTVRLAADHSPDLSYTDVIAAAARMRPDRLVFGELRGAEVMRILEIISFGHDGSMMTMHATSPEDALARLEAMCLMANLGLGLGEIRYRIASTINLIAVLLRLPDGGRRVVQITELRGLENERYILQPLVRYNVGEDKFEMTGVMPSWEAGRAQA